MHNDKARYSLQQTQGYPVKAPKKFAWLIAWLMLLGWNGAQAHATLPRGNANDAPASARDKILGEVKPFVPASATIVAVETGDLNGDGRMDALLVINPPAGPSMPPSPEASRVVMLLVRDANGHLQKAAENDKIVPCEGCGGTAGDPFAFAKLSDGGFEIVTGGGSRERWSNFYTFTYSPPQKAWLASKVTRGVVDSYSETEKRVTLTRKDLGSVDFTHFDPSKFPSPTIP